MLAQQRKELARHEGTKVQDAAGAHAGPFAVGTGQHDVGVLQPQQLQCAEDLYLFTAHHVRNTVMLAAQAGHDGDPPRLNPCQPLSQIVKPGRARAVGRLCPALLTACHA